MPWGNSVLSPRTANGGPWEMSVGILAYGSLITDPGKELRSHIAGTIGSVETPFAVEFGRSSGSRNGAPTLIPVDSGGSRVQGKVLVLGPRIGLDDAQTLLWRRETRNEFSTERYRRPKSPGRDRVVVDSIADFAGLDTVLYTNIGSNIECRTADYLATLARVYQPKN